MLSKSYKISISKDVKKKLEEQFDYIFYQQQEPVLADKWIIGIDKAISSLVHFPERCAIAPENSLENKRLKTIVRHLIYKKSFRIIFIIIKNEVKILTVKHSAQKIIVH